MSNLTDYEIAKALYLNTNKSKGEIAELVGKTPKTIGKWSNGGGPGKYKGEDWDAEKRARTISADKQIAKFYAMLENTNNMIFRKPEFDKDGNLIAQGRDGIPTSGDADLLKKLTAAIRDLRQVGPKEYVLAIEDFVSHIAVEDLELAKRVADHMISFLREKIEEIED